MAYSLFRMGDAHRSRFRNSYNGGLAKGGPLGKQSRFGARWDRVNDPTRNFTIWHEKLHAGCLPSFVRRLHPVGADAIIDVIPGVLQEGIIHAFGVAYCPRDRFAC